MNDTTLLNTLFRRAETISRMAVWAGGAMLLASVALVCFDVVTRKLLDSAMSGSNELSGYALAISTSWALAFGMLQKINVRVDVLYRALPVRIAAVLDWLAVVLMAVFIAILTYFAYFVTQTSWQQGATANTVLGTRLWIPQGLWLLGLLWMCVVLAVMLVRSSIALVTGEHEALRQLCGPRGTLDEAEEEATMAASRTSGQVRTV